MPQKTNLSGTIFVRLFLAHPQAVNESFAEHFIAALSYAIRLQGAALAAFVHALLPCAFETTASRLISEMSQEISARKNASTMQDSATALEAD